VERLDVLTLSEGHYDLGVGTLVNSLVAAGFRGTVHVRHRGPQPRWLPPELPPGEPYEVADGVAVSARPTDADRHLTDRHLTNGKALALTALFEETEADGLLYVDPDVVVEQDWGFFADWTASGIALCADSNPWFPASHPTRKAWLRLAAELGDDVVVAPPLDLYVNAGLVGVRRDHLGFLADWERYTSAFAARTPAGLWSGPEAAGGRGRWSPFQVVDQDALNLAAMKHSADVSLIGPQGMGLAPGWSVVLHATGAPKPWSGGLLRATLRGRPLRQVDAGWLRHTAGPVGVLPARARAVRRASVAASAVVTRFAGR
jgi:hypothetical protein